MDGKTFVVSRKIKANCLIKSLRNPVLEVYYNATHKFIQ